MKILTKIIQQKGRPLVKKAKTFGITLRRLDRSELPLFKEITSATSNRRDYVDKSLDYYQDFYDCFGDACEFMVASLNFQDYLKHLESDQAKLENESRNFAQLLKIIMLLKRNKISCVNYQANQQPLIHVLQKPKHSLKIWLTNVILAGSLFVYTKQEAVYLFSGSYPEFNKFYAPALLQEYVMLEAIKRGITTYNLLGITGEFDGSDGVLRFKQNYNGYITRKMGTFRYYPHPLKYKLIHNLKNYLDVTK